MGSCGLRACAQSFFAFVFVFFLNPALFAQTDRATITGVRHEGEILVRVRDEALHCRVDLVKGEFLALFRVARHTAGSESDHREVGLRVRAVLPRA